MSLEFGSVEPLPHVSAIYTCRACGRVAARHGAAVGELPPGWVELRDEREADYACASCAGEAARQDPLTERRPP
jgi:hypothetical protein